MPLMEGAIRPPWKRSSPARARSLHRRRNQAGRVERDARRVPACGDYLGRGPFGPDSAEMSRQAEKFLRAVPPYPQGRYQGRGVVVATSGDRSIAGLYVTIRALRHVGCTLPLQVWHMGLSAKEKGVLAPFQVECVDVDKIRRRHATRRLNGGELKVFAALHSPFEEACSSTPTAIPAVIPNSCSSAKITGARCRFLASG